MAELEKVIKDMNEAIVFVECRGYEGIANTIRDALELLKEQEAEIRQLRLTLEHKEEIIKEAIGLCESCRKAIERAKERIKG